MDISDNKKIGMFMMGLGAAFTGLGVLLFFDRALLALGNVLFVGGFPFLIGVKHTLALFNPLARGARYVVVVGTVVCGARACEAGNR